MYLYTLTSLFVQACTFELVSINYSHYCAWLRKIASSYQTTTSRVTFINNLWAYLINFWCYCAMILEASVSMIA